jgi:hypothetical protein
MSAVPRPASCPCTDFGAASVVDAFGASASFALAAGVASPSSDVVVVADVGDGAPAGAPPLSTEGDALAEGGGGACAVSCAL